MKKISFILLMLIVASSQIVSAQTPQKSLFKVRGFAIAAPQPKEVDSFIKFIDEELAPKNINTLILRVDFDYQYESFPQLRDSIALSKAEVKKLVAVCRKNGIRIIPQINLLGHQSWASRVTNLLKKFPEFDETPSVVMPKEYHWPNPDGLYCKSYCPLHPDVHRVVFGLIDELCDAFEATAFHAGMDEVFYIGDDRCPRCGGVDKANLFAGEVNRVHDHLALTNRELWIWGDRLLDGKTTGLGMWEASMNNTHRAIDLISKDVVICDWHYERPDLTAVYFAMKGFRVVTCPWNEPAIAALQVDDMATFKQHTSPEMSDRYYGMVQTVWSGVGNFLDGYYHRNQKPAAAGSNPARNPWDTFRSMTARMNERDANVKTK